MRSHRDRSAARGRSIEDAVGGIWLGGWLSLLLCLAPLGSLLLGCSIWKESPSEPFELPKTRMSADSIAMELTFVRVPVGQAEFDQQLWQQLDEQPIPIATRQHLNDNGFRCGLVGAQLPSVLRDLLDQQSASSLGKLTTPASTPMDVLAQNRRVQARAGQRTEVVTSSLREQMVMLHKDRAGTKVGGKSFRDAQCILAARSYPQGDGTVQLELTPEVHHGLPRQQVVAGEGTFQLLTGREREVFEDLLLKLSLAPGQTLVLSCTPDRKGLGENFFVESGQGDAQQKLLLIRLTQTQRDDLFDPPPHESPASRAKRAEKS